MLNASPRLEEKFIALKLTWTQKPFPSLFPHTITTDVVVIQTLLTFWKFLLTPGIFCIPVHIGSEMGNKDTTEADGSPKMLGLPDNPLAPLTFGNDF